MARNTVLNITQPLVKDGTVEVHYFTPGEDSRYIVGGVIQDYEIDVDKILVDHKAVLKSFNIRRGDFNAVINIYDPILGSAEFPMIYLKEISPDRRELRFEHVAVDNLEEHEGMLQSFIDYYSDRTLPEFVLNFGRNRLFKFINQKIFGDENNLVIRLLDPLPNDIEEESTAWIAGELSDSVNDDGISIDSISVDDNMPELRGPNFEVDTTYGTITETSFESWNTLLDASTATSQNIVDRMFSGSLSGVPIGIDYSGFNNFIQFSSATERIANFKYKLQLIEYYNTRVGTLNAVSGSDSSALKNNITINTSKKDNIIGSFDGFERWLYNEATASLFTDQLIYSTEDYEIEGGRLGAQMYRVQPCPKFISNGKYQLHHTTSSISQNWYDGVYASASLYDSENESALIKTIPEHIRLDKNNSQYELFINMIGHHYDIIYSYIDKLSKTYHHEEHPKLGHGKDTLYEIAKSLGWSLTDGNQASALWQYKLGVDSGSGAYQSTGSLFSKSDEEITTEVWRRIVNNLPYLLKTKGTARSVKALMNTYGIPQTLLSIREYGGPKVSGDVPTLIEDRFSYALTINSGSNILVPSSRVSASAYPKSIAWATDTPPAFNVPIITREYRFRPVSKSNMLLQSGRGSNSTIKRDMQHIAIEYTASYSGSDKYGRIHMSVAQSASATPWLPLFDGDFWNLRQWYDTTATDTTSEAYWNADDNTSTTYKVQVQKASDYITGKIIHEASASFTPTKTTHHDGWSTSTAGDFDNEYGILFLGGKQTHTHASSDSYGAAAALTGSMGLTQLPGTFSGSIQEYREWAERLNQTTFNLHTLNPTSYVSSISPTSSFDTLVLHYPFGTDLNAIDHSTGPGLTISSSHPNNAIKDFTRTIGDYKPLVAKFGTYASASGFNTPVNTERGNYQPVEETYYIQGVSLGGNLPRSQKIRLEDNELVSKLSPTNTAERSRFDRAPLDTNRLGLFYSMADQTNKDIFNHIGDVELDDYIGNPEDEFISTYPNLEHFSKEYWKKYTNRNDINAYIRIFSQFDFALFSQIKQLLPERVDEAMGLLVEPNALERTKIHITKRPVVTNPQYSVTITEHVPSGSGHILPLSASIAVVENLITMESIYHTGSNSYSDVGNHFGNIQILATGSYTGSVNEGFVMTARSSSIYNRDIFYYSSSMSQSLGLYYSRSLSVASYRDDLNTTTDNLWFNGCKLSGPGVNINSNITAIDNKPVVEVFAVNPNQLIYSEQPAPDEQGPLQVR